MPRIHRLAPLYLAALACTSAHAQTGLSTEAGQTSVLNLTPPAAAPAQTHNRIEVGLGGASLSNGNKSWSDGWVRGNHHLQPGTNLNWELAGQRHYGQYGTVAALGLTQDLSPDWYASFGVAAGTADFQNRYRGDVAIYRKWGENRQWVTGLSFMRSASNDRIHRDSGLTASLAYYSPNAWVAEGGLVFNRSNPGSVDSTRGFVAFTLGREKQHYFTVRLDHGQEAYLPAGAVGPIGRDVQRFNSTELTLQWRQWVKPQWGYVLGAQGYRNPYYDRAGVNAGLFYDF